MPLSARAPLTRTFAHAYVDEDVLYLEVGRKSFTFPQKQLLNPCFDQSDEFLMSGDISKRFQAIENFRARIESI